MKIILVGATGTLGKAIHAELSQRHEIIRASANQGEVKVDLTDRSSIERMYKEVGAFDAMVCAAGGAYFGSFAEMTEEDFYTGIRSKMMGQINLVMVGKDLINAGGSFTLTTGILADDPVPGAVGLSMVNGAVNAFGVAAAIEMTRDVRINVVSPGLVEESVDKYGPYFPGHIPISMKKMVSGYVKSVEGKVTGQVIRLFG